MATNRVVYETTIEERLQRLEERVELMRELLVETSKLVSVLVKPRKEQTA